MILYLRVKYVPVAVNFGALEVELWYVGVFYVHLGVDFGTMKS